MFLWTDRRGSGPIVCMTRRGSQTSIVVAAAVVVKADRKGRIRHKYFVFPKLIDYKGLIEYQ